MSSTEILLAALTPQQRIMVNAIIQERERLHDCATRAEAGIAELSQAWRKDRDARRAEADELKRSILELTEKYSGQMSASRRTSAALVVVLGALEALVSVCESVCEEEGWTNNAGAFQKRIREAKEVIAAHGIPF